MADREKAPWVVEICYISGTVRHVGFPSMKATQAMVKALHLKMNSNSMETIALAKGREVVEATPVGVGMKIEDVLHSGIRISCVESYRILSNGETEQMLRAGEALEQEGAGYGD